MKRPPCHAGLRWLFGFRPAPACCPSASGITATVRAGGLRAWIRNASARQAGLPAGGPIRVLCMPRVLGFAFNPLTVFFCYAPAGHATGGNAPAAAGPLPAHRLATRQSGDMPVGDIPVGGTLEDGPASSAQDGKLLATLYEVNNTFGQRHGYLLPVEGRQDRDRAGMRQGFPCFPLHGHGLCATASASARRTRTYRLAFRCSMTVAACVLAASFAGDRQRTDRPPPSCAKSVLAMPFQGAKVLGGIHWEAAEAVAERE